MTSGAADGLTRINDAPLRLRITARCDNQATSTVVPANAGTHNPGHLLLKEGVDHRAQQYPPRCMDPGSRSLCSLVRDDGMEMGTAARAPSVRRRQGKQAVAEIGMTKVLNSTFTEYVSDALTELPHAAAVYVKVGATPLGPK
jgi:hypothetical protein